MCYYIYGALFGDVDENEYSAIENKYELKIRKGTKHSLKKSVQEVSEQYRVTNWCCDCDSALGGKDSETQEIKMYEAFLNDIKGLNGAKYIYLCKTWAGKTNKKEIQLKLNDINVGNTLAEFNENCLYTFEV